MSEDLRERPDFDSEIDRLSFEISQTNRRLVNAIERIDQLEYNVNQLVNDLPTQTRSKREKKFAILERVYQDAEPGMPAGAIYRDKAAGVADCSDRHARTLLKELGEDFDGAEYHPRGDPHGRLTVDFPDGDREAFIDHLEDVFPEVER